MQDFGNPDPRPLPDGWNQHYDASRNNWYYVQTSVMPPKVSYQHPADLRPEPTRRRGSRTSAMPPPPPPMTMPMPSTSIGPPPQSNGGSGLSFAQRLYASSNNTEQTPPLISATARDFGNMSTPHPPPIQTPSLPTLPTPLPSVSPGFRPPRTLPTIPQENHALPQANATDFYNNNLGFGNFGNSRSAHLQTPSNSSWLPSSHDSTNSSFPSPYMNESPEASLGPHPSHHPHLHRTQSYQIPPPPPLAKDPPHPHRASTYSASSSARPPSSSGPRILTTTARPPNTINTSDSTPHLQTVSPPPQPVIQAPIPGIVTSPLSLGLPSPPYSQGSLSPPINSPPPPSMFQSLPANNAQVVVQPQPKPPTISPAQAAQHEQRNQLLKQIGVAVGKSAGKVALKVTGNALLNATGLSPDLFSGMGDILNSDAVGSLVDNLSGVEPSKPQAASQGQPGPDLQAIISALTQQQQQSNPQSQQPQQTPSVDYQALINELQKIQPNTSAQQPVAQQQAAPQQQVPAQTDAFSQLQALLNAASKPPQQHNHQQHHHHQNNHHQHNHQQHNHQQHHHHHGGHLNALQQQLQTSNFSGFNPGMGSFNSGFDVVDPSIIAQGFAAQDAAIF